MTDLGIEPAVKGRLLRVEEPDWAPLARLTEDDALILRQFMWMGCLRLTDGRVVHMYKHIDTRRHLHLAEDLTPFDYHDEDEHPYRTSTLGIALREVFCLCRELGCPEEDELLANEALVERHSRHPRVPAGTSSTGRAHRR